MFVCKFRNDMRAALANGFRPPMKPSTEIRKRPDSGSIELKAKKSCYFCRVQLRSDPQKCTDGTFADRNVILRVDEKIIVV